MPIALIPQPQRLRWTGGRFACPRSFTIGIADGTLDAVARLVGSLLGGQPSVSIARPSISDAVTILWARGLRADGYRLAVTPGGIRLAAGSAAGAFAGAQTLRQILAQSSRRALPGVTIDDWPAFADRGLYYDVCRGRVPQLERLLELADTLAQYKYNQLQLYIEHTFAFRGHPDIGRGASPLSADDILRLDAHCRARHIELVPSLASFGHLATVLKHPRYRHLAEDWGIGKYLAPEAAGIPAWQKHIAWTLSPANPRIYRFLDELFAEFLPLFSSPRFNVCCDETWDLGLGQSYVLCRKLGKGRVYLNHLLALHDLCRKYGKRMMFWGDIIRHHPELIPELPKDVTVLDWGYAFDHPFDRIKDFKKAGVPFYACPGTSSWVTLFPRLPNATANIAAFAAAGHRHGAQGLLLTDWGDGGHANFMENSWHGYLLGAEQAWNPAAERATFTERFCRVFLKSADRRLMRALEALGAVAQLNCPGGYYEGFWRHVFFKPVGDPIFSLGSKEFWTARGGRIVKRRLTPNAALGRATLLRLDALRPALARHVGARGEDPQGVLPYWVFAVDALRHAARKMSVLGAGGRDTPAARAALRDELRALRRRFVTLWMARNRRSEIRITLALYREAERSLR